MQTKKIAKGSIIRNVEFEFHTVFGYLLSIGESHAVSYLK